jgi:hypothetical protein
MVCQVDIQAANGGQITDYFSSNNNKNRTEAEK